MTKKKHRRVLIFCMATVLLLFSWSAHGAAIGNEDCMQCHADSSLARQSSEGIKDTLFVDQKKFNYSVHNVNGIGCVDCHEAIKELNMDNEVPHATNLPSVNCGNCHTDESTAYENSVHRKAHGKGINIPCFGCHEYHYPTRLVVESVYERENGFCLKCHNPDKFHDWLPQKQTHFAFVECTVCHAPETPRHINLRFYDFIKNRFLTSEELLVGLKTDAKGFIPMVDTDKNGQISAEEFENIVLLLRQANIRGTFHAELVVELIPAVHHVNRGEAQKQCETCHVPTSPFFQDVRVLLAKDDGTSVDNRVDRAVLTSYYVNHFYALGGTRVRELDKVGIALIAGGLGVVGLHLTARIVTAPARRKKSETHHT